MFMVFIHISMQTRLLVSLYNVSDQASSCKTMHKIEIVQKIARKTNFPVPYRDHLLSITENIIASRQWRSRRAKMYV